MPFLLATDSATCYSTPVSSMVKGFKGIVSCDIDGLFTILFYSLDVGVLPLGVLFFNFMFSYFNFNINVGAVLILTAPPFPEKVVQLG
jgi:hypothetical protein